MKFCKKCGKQLNPGEVCNCTASAATQMPPRTTQPPFQPTYSHPPPPTQSYMTSSAQAERTIPMQGQAAIVGESYFDGGLLQLIGWRIAGFFVILFTLGICTPWAICMIYRWETKHTVLQGKRLMFTGSAIGR